MSREKEKSPFVEGTKEFWQQDGWRVKAVFKSTFVHILLIAVWVILDIGIKDQFLVGMMDETMMEYVPGLMGYLIVAWTFYELHLKGRVDCPKRQAALWLLATHPLMYSPFKDGWKFITCLRMYKPETPQ